MEKQNTERDIKVFERFPAVETKQKTIYGFLDFVMNNTSSVVIYKLFTYLRSRVKLSLNSSEFLTRLCMLYGSLLFKL